MEDPDLFSKEEEAQYEEWLQKNYKFLRRFMYQCLKVDVDRESDYYDNSEWYESSIRIDIPYQLDDEE